ncbi:FMN-dependent alpha-hydroxy acid dehydrogenase [Phanerochaete sordida]|uniref:FMN-dependent alpha-hydroxy acid dehydrogenase n=1 Tax=Phanerochaete sordida TaxID=48140 RepID=A0A9P3LFH0_9APHY|nr:FMN-dependent alpha-hydroxy acid dehydrogenase [Phanerochaete sordida]
MTDAKKSWSSYMLDIYLERKPLALPSFYFDDIEREAREKLKDRQDAFLYVFGSAGNGSAERWNRRALDSWRIIPRMLRDATERNLETTLFGVRHRSPLLVAPVGVQGIVHPDGEIASAKAAAAVGVPYIMSTAATRTIEAVAQANGDGHRWFQLYWPVSDECTISLLKRAKANGFTALVVTLDTMLLGWRPHDLQTSYLPFLHGVGAQVGLSDPVFMATLDEPPILDVPAFPYDPKKTEKLLQAGDEKTESTCNAAIAWMRQTNSGTFHTWDQLKVLRDNWDGPLIIKGILSVQDAELAMAHGVDGIIVSSHGGRQVEAAVPAVWALEQICGAPRIRDAQKSGKLTVLFDSGVRTGGDMLKALALGAQAVLVARPYMYGLAVAGQAGVEQVLRALLADAEISLGLAGYKSVDEIWHNREEVLVKLGDAKL